MVHDVRPVCKLPVNVVLRFYCICTAIYHLYWDPTLFIHFNPNTSAILNSATKTSDHLAAYDQQTAVEIWLTKMLSKWVRVQAGTELDRYITSGCHTRFD